MPSSYMVLRNRELSFLPIVLLLLELVACSSSPQSSISGRIVADDCKDSAECNQQAIWIRLYSHKIAGGKILPIAKQDLDKGSGLAPIQWSAMVRAESISRSTFTYTMNCPPGNYSVFAFRDPSDNGTLPLSHQLGLGWHTGPNCLGGSYMICSRVLKVAGDEHISDADVTLRSPRAMPDHGVDPSGHGAVRMLRNHRVLHLNGTAAERGFAHGFLLAKQILDFFEFFVLEDRVQSTQVYSSQVFPKLHPNLRTFKYTEEFQEAAQGILAGMRAANVPLHIPSLGRDFQLEDLYAINVYGDLDLMIDNGARGSCTQFVFFGEETLGTDMDGAPVAGRNMDGEVDFRRLTVSHLLIIAVTPTRGRRYISLMWPGFVGTFSGFNEDGLYIMENFGCPPPWASATGHELVPNIDVIASILQSGAIGHTATAQTLRHAMSQYTSPDGGPCSHSAILVFARPHTLNASALPPGFMYECDRYGGELRLPDDPAVRPVAPTNILASNHFMRYHADASQFDRDALKFECNSGQPTWYSLWRYAAAQNTIEAWERAGERIGSQKVKQLLQLVSKGITEHSVLWRPQQLEFELAVPKLDSPWWDASYSVWDTFRFEEVFFDISGCLSTIDGATLGAGRLSNEMPQSDVDVVTTIQFL